MSGLIDLYPFGLTGVLRQSIPLTYQKVNTSVIKNLTRGTIGVLQVKYRVLKPQDIKEFLKWEVSREITAEQAPVLQ